MEATIFTIQRFSLHDGGGIRTVVFFKGCPLRCTWCSNPESQKTAPEVMYNDRICLHCGACVAASQNNALSMEEDAVIKINDRNAHNGQYTEVCPANAMRLVGKSIAIKELTNRALMDLPYYRNSSGGVTLSGGEPFMQPDAALALLIELKMKRVHTAVETCGHVDGNALAQAVPYVDQFLFDYKISNPEKHKKYTGVDNSRILENLRMLKELGANIVLRAPLIPGINMDEEHYAGLCAIMSELKLNHVELLPFHQYGKGKYTELGMEYGCNDFCPPDTIGMQQIKDSIAHETGAIVY
ncbi:glycyl-radical enzyme activating protein [Desulfovibrio desulfuricans]|uniref:glycyl-radical enzyme activating protein n=1 Tax=Desulfovibrio desulfuricans TaxID=876 RepID=UPI001D075311|nr:glycyl-radical enzyme activating protein [Desulfovibrio desulfuricans]MCB6543556.1 glycyl-radical enzyme activating protein [Desulfovibrio desulfuricans]MCB6554081.1 glycyl-radical enzyme activating protein [Desulfovibrio desulfuricans]MCB6565985.1 glycyl-radical enzyme activating protein [Desulfovibrio desulfuricans]MCB7347125.1 glycyl-radical enzyme activating protein [Desulfovibrio desulfuricans]MCQ5219604.1 glycyl-radical enzyme activating protein [Desulfovibrio desulfuricans]